jgi:arylsulfatase A-like enzyme
VPARGGWIWLGLILGAAAWLQRIPASVSPVSRVTMQPPEVTFYRTWSGRDKTVPPPEAASLIRRVLTPEAGQQWTDDHWPLIHTLPAAPARVDDPPDVIVIAIESLRARHLGYINPAQAAVTPQLNQLARDSVQFPRYISNGYPSAPGFFALHTGTVPHRNRTVTAEFTTTAFDALPRRLKDFGYHRVAIWGGNVNMGNQFAWARQWYDEVDFDIPGNESGYYYSRGDAETFRVLKDHISRRDQASSRQPLFMFVATAGTHGPFTTAHAVFTQAEDAAEAEPFRELVATTDRAENYDHMLRLLDRQIGLLREFLARRDRANNTVLIICGDHSVSVTERVEYSIRNFPTDGAVWTTALIHGPQKLVGPPRTLDFPASAADLLPTVLAMAGDNRPRAGMGADLFGSLPPAKRMAVAVREDGYRLDRGGWSLFVSAADPSDYFVHRSFEDRERTRASDPGGPFTAQDARDLHAAVQGWSWLVEQNRVWSARWSAP